MTMQLGSDAAAFTTRPAFQEISDSLGALTFLKDQFAPAPRLVRVKGQKHLPWLEKVAVRLEELSRNQALRHEVDPFEALSLLSPLMPLAGIAPSVLLSEDDGIEFVWRAGSKRLSIEFDGRDATVDFYSPDGSFDGPLDDHKLETIREIDALTLEYGTDQQ